MKFVRSSQVATRTAATWLALIATVVFLFAARAMIARVLGPVGIGRYALMLTSAWVASTVLSLGLPAYNASFASKKPGGVLLGNAVAWNAAAFLLLSLVCVPLLRMARLPATTNVLIVGLWMAPMLSMVDCTRGILQGTGAIAAYNWLGLAGGALNVMAIGLLLAAARLTLRGAVLCWIATTLLGAVLAVTIGHRRVSGRPVVDRQVLRESLYFGGQAWLSQLTGILNFRIALLLTQVLLGTASVGFYAIAVSMAETLFYFPNALAAVTVSRYAAASRAEARALLRRSTGWVMLVSTVSAAALAVLGGPFIQRVFGPAYAPSLDALRILLPGVVLYTPIAVSAWYFNAHLQQPAVNLLVAGFSAVLNGTLMLLWAPRHGLNGVAWATTTAYAMASLFNAGLVSRRSGRSADSKVGPAYVEPAGDVDRITRTWWRALQALDYGVAILIYLSVPRRMRERWFMPGTQLRNRHASAEVFALLDEGRRARVLDVGGGVAALTETLRQDPRVSVVTLDLDIDVLRRAAARTQDAALVCADGTQLPFADDTFDAVVMVHALEHIPEGVRGPLAAELKRVSRRGVVIHGPAGNAAIELSKRFIEVLSGRGVQVPRYAYEHLEFSMPMPAWFTATFPGCRLTPRRNFDVELTTIITEFTPLIRWLSGYRHNRLAAGDDRPPFVEYTMTWRKVP